MANDGAAPVTTELRSLALGKLASLVGRERAETLFIETMLRADLAELITPDDLLRFAEVLEAQGGFVGVMGGVLRIQAVLKGARGA